MDMGETAKFGFDSLDSRVLSSEEALGSSLDSFQRNSNTAGAEDFCTQTVAKCRLAIGYVLSGTRDEDGLFPHLRTFCKSYACEHCGPRKVAAIRRGIELAILKFGLNTFATLTLDPKTCGCSAEDSAKYIRKVWNKFRIIQKREFGRGLEFVAVIEFKKMVLRTCMSFSTSSFGMTG